MRERSGFRLDVEGLRAVAVLAVVLFHAGVPGISGGFIGVDVFFVISGFLITGLLWREVSNGGTVRLGRFYGARARRLLPASALVGIVTVIVAAFVLPSLEARTVIGDGIASALYVSNFRFLLQNTDYFFAELAPSPFQHYWSLGVEEQFYLVWPAVIIGTTWLFRRRRRRAGIVGDPGAAVSSRRPYLWALALIAILSFALSMLVMQMNPLAAFFSSPTRAWELALGGLVALTADQWRRLPRAGAAVIGWVGLAVVLVTAALLQSTTPYPGTAALLPVLGTAAVIGAGCAAPTRGAGRLLSIGPMRAVGQVSYSWYLWHWPVLILAAPVLGHPLSLPGRLATVAISGVLAVLTLRFVENPFRFAPSVRTSTRRSLVVGAVATAAAVCVGVAMLVVVPSPVGRGPAAPALAFTGPDAFAQVQAAVAASARVTAVPSNLEPPLAEAGKQKLSMRETACIRYFLESDQPDCVTGDTASTTTVALVGDSNGAMWSPAFQELATQRQWRLETLTKSGCPLLDLAIMNRDLRRDYSECYQWRTRVLDRLKAERPRLIVLGMWRGYGPDWGRQPYDTAWMESLTRMVRQLRDTGAQVLVIGPIPDPGSVVPICLSGHLDDAMACSQPKSKAVNASGIAAENVATKAGGGQYADVTDLFCAGDLCPPIVGNTLVYFDAEHATFEYSRLLAPVMSVLAERALAGG